MLGQAIWWGSILLETLLLIRGFRGLLLRRYPVFYIYIGFVWLQSLLRFSVYHLRPNLYSPVYWITQALGVLVGCAVVFEIYRVGLRAYPGTARMARNVLAFVFVMALTKVLVDTWNDPLWLWMTTNAHVERALRIVQSLGILALVLLFLFYSIPFGRNLRGILLGYGLFVAVSVIQLTFVANGNSWFSSFWSHVSPGSYLTVLGVWAVHLWSYRAIPEPHKAVELEQQYQRLAAATSRRLREARGYLAKAVRP